MPKVETNLSSKEGILHVLIVTGGGVCLIGGDVEDGAFLDGEILVTDGVTGTDLGALSVEGNGERTASLETGGLTGVVNDRLVVLRTFHANDVETNCDRVSLPLLNNFTPSEKVLPYLCGEH
jgi:hypothetical protein